MGQDRPEGRWAASGAQWLTGDAGGPGLVAPAGVVARIEALGAPFGLDALALVGERAAVAGLRRSGATTCGGAGRLVPSADGWVAVNLARPDDWDLVPAWLGVDGGWGAVAAAVARRPADRVVAAGRELGLAVAALPARVDRPGPVSEVVPEPGLLLTDGQTGPAAGGTGLGGAETGVAGGGAPGGRASGGSGAGAAASPGRPPGAGDHGVRQHLVAQAPAIDRPPRVVDLSSLWAGPLCAHLLGLQGAAVVKVESPGRPDGARRGPAAFYDLLHAGHRAVAVDLSTPSGVADLHRLLLAADVVVEASRPRALSQLGIDAEELVAAADGPMVWLSITGHGRTGSAAGWVGFGDDAAVAGGLVAWGADGGPRFVADAVADPLTGMAAAGAVVGALGAGGRWLLDAPLAGVASWVAGPDAGATWPEGDPADERPPRARPAAAVAAAPGSTSVAQVLAGGWSPTVRSAPALLPDGDRPSGGGSW